MNYQLVKTLKDAGVKLTDDHGNYRSFEDVISQIASKWDRLKKEGLSDNITKNLLLK